MDDSSSTFSSDARPGRRAFMTALAGAGALGVGALALPMPDPVRSGEIVRTPYDGRTFDIDPKFIAGLSRPSRVVTNAQGLRGNLLRSRPGDVLILGGSTAQCLLLDEQHSLERVLQTQLRAAGIADAAVANAGFAGLPAAQLLAEFDAIIEREDRWPRRVLALFGANEAEQVLNHAPWVRSSGGELVLGFDENGPYGPGQWARTYAGWYTPGNHGAFMVRPRAAYRAAPKATSLPAKTRAFLGQQSSVYAAALDELALRCAAREIELFVVTQPINFDPKDPTAGHDWAPFIFAKPGAGFVPSPPMLHGLVDGFNRVARTVAQARGLTVIDLASALASQGDCFYDQWHFTIAGAARAGQALAQALAPRMLAG